MPQLLMIAQLKASIGDEGPIAGSIRASTTSFAR
jgi:hypothetical protein